jgi:hypothetical protein
MLPFKQQEAEAFPKVLRHCWEASAEQPSAPAPSLQNNWATKIKEIIHENQTA